MKMMTEMVIRNICIGHNLKSLYNLFYFDKNTLYWCWILSEKNDDVKTLYSVLTDRQQEEKKKRGDEAAFTAIYERYWKEVLGHAYKRLHETSAAEDVVQNVFVSIWQRDRKSTLMNSSHVA